MIDTEAIRARYAHYGPTDKLKANTAVLHVRQLLDEVERLRDNQAYEPFIAGSGETVLRGGKPWATEGIEALEDFDIELVDGRILSPRAAEEQ
jgi:nucleotide-binding universal stress UspA family protein